MVPGHKSEQRGEYDELRNEGMDNSVSLQQFFERPILITDIAWTQGGAALFQNFNPWQLFFENPRVINRLSNYKLLQAKLHVKAVLNGTPFNFGSAIMSYAPLYPTYDDLTRNRSAFRSDIMAASQRPHVYLDPANNSGGTISCPFVWHKNALDIVAAEWREMGEMNVREIYALKHATGTVNNVTISIYAWATDVKLAGPTQYNALDISPQSDEYSKPAVSTAATALSTWTKGLSNAPIIGPYMRATSMASSAVAAVASLFGYCKPVELEFELLRQRTTGPMATTNSKDDSHKLTVDAKQEITIDPRAFGLCNEDELEISYVAGRESWLDTFDWSIGNAPETVLWSTVVDPWLIRQEAGGEIHLTPMAFASLPFTWWRGSLVFRFQVVCSKFHRGRLRVVYDPEGAGSNLLSGIAEYNTAFNTIVDISETTDFEIRVGWAQGLTYRQHAPADTPQADMFTDGNPAVGYTSSTFDFGNGVLAVYVVNDLAAPDTTVDNDIGVNVFVKAGPDFEVAGPTSAYLNRMRFRPQSEELPMHNLPSTAPLSAPQVDSYLADADLTGPCNLIHFGESIRSFRPLLKRYNMHEWNMSTSISLTNSQTQFFAFDRPAMPFEPGIAPQADITSSVPQLVGAAYYAYANMTLLKYISTAYVGWRGSVRWKIANNPCCEQAAPFIVSRYTGCAPLNSVATPTFPITDNVLGTFYDSTGGMDGAVIEFATVAPVIPFEVPYYTGHRFCPARELTDFRATGGKPYLPCFKTRSVSMVTTPTEQIDTKPFISFCAAGEDFTTGFFVGSPVLFLETAIPTPS